VEVPAPAAPRPRSPLIRLLADRAGEPRPGVVLALSALAVAMLLLGTAAGLMAAGTGSPRALAYWVLAAFLFIKLPLLALVWWVLTRRRETARSGGWSTDECARILAYLEQQAADALGRRDAAQRLSYFAREAWYVADAAADRDKARAVASAVRIEGLAARARIPPGRAERSGSPPPGRA
jgi:hypothetical protein